MTKGRIVLLNPPLIAASGDSGDIIDKMFDDGNDANQEHSVGKDDDVLEEVVALDASKVGAEKAKKKRKRKMTEGVSGSASSHWQEVSFCPLWDGFGGFCSYFETASLVRYAADVPVVTVFVTTTVDANVATGSKAKDMPKDFEHIGDFASVGGVDADAANISNCAPWISISFILNSTLGAARQVCLRAEVTMRAKHTLERKSKLEDKCAEQATFLSKKDAEIAHLRSLLSLKEAEDAEAISFRSQLSVVEATDAANGTELRELKEKNFSLEGKTNVFSERAEALESVAAFKEFFKEQVEKMHDEKVGVLNDRVAAIDSDLMEMVLYMDAEFYPRYLTTIVGRRGMQDGLAAGIKHGIAERSITDVTALEANKDASMVDIMDLLRLEGHADETSEASQLQPSLDQLMIPIHRLEDQVIIGEILLAFSLEDEHNCVQRLRGDAAARRLSLMDYILPLVKPLSTRNITGEESSSADFTTAVTTALSTTFVQTYLVPTTLSTEVPPSPKVIFEE
nr:hypothetical protein [Tanacetum cinerariifolium]